MMNYNAELLISSLLERDKGSDCMEMKQRVAELFRRPQKNFYVDESVHDLGKGPNRRYTLTLHYDTPGWIAFDFQAEVGHDTSQNVSRAEFQVYVDDELKYRARGAYTFTRQYLYVNEGTHKFDFVTNDAYKPNEQAWVRYINGTMFEKLTMIDGIGSITPPRKKAEIIQFNTLNGIDRYQRTGIQGTDIEMTLYFTTPENAEEFLYDDINFYIFRYSGGLYGGTLLPQNAEYERMGRLYAIKVYLTSPQLVGDKAVKI